MKHASLFALSLVAFLSISATPVSAETAEQSQKLEQELKVECTTGSYGQNSTCKAEGKQTAEQKQKISVRSGAILGTSYHKPINAGLDLPVMLAAAGVTLASVSAGVYQLKRNV